MADLFGKVALTGVVVRAKGQNATDMGSEFLGGETIGARVVAS